MNLAYVVGSFEVVGVVSPAFDNAGVGSFTSSAGPALDDLIDRFDK